MKDVPVFKRGVILAQWLMLWPSFDSHTYSSRITNSSHIHVKRVRAVKRHVVCGYLIKPLLYYTRICSGEATLPSVGIAYTSAKAMPTRLVKNWLSKTSMSHPLAKKQWRQYAAFIITYACASNFPAKVMSLCVKYFNKRIFPFIILCSVQPLWSKIR